MTCGIGDVGPTKFVQMMILGWPLPTLNGFFFFEKLIFFKMLKSKSLYWQYVFNLMRRQL